MNNPIWIMSSAFEQLTLAQLIEQTTRMGAQGIDLCVFRKDGTRQDHVATHLDYDHFGPEEAKHLLDEFNQAGLQLSLGAFENMIGGDMEQRLKNQNHLLKLIRMAYLLGGDANNIKVGTFVGYNHELGVQENGFQKNLNEYLRVFGPIVQYAESLGVTILYENCPMEGWRSAAYTSTYNNLPAVLAARKLMYTLIPSKAHGEIYDPSHDIWQHTDPVAVIADSDIRRIHRIHVKTTRNLQTPGRIAWGGMYPMQQVDATLAAAAGVAQPVNDWDRHHYEAMLPGFGGTDDMDWTAFVQTLQSKGFDGPFEIENEAKNSKDTGNFAATVQGCEACIRFLSPLLWNLTSAGYVYSGAKPLQLPSVKDIPIKTMADVSSNYQK
ncbi:hypothetical protein GCM10023231_38860 [Olivibacter ginsenosidimutans]|uniref:Xylose isomerase-like TIM barrel domain-containing protein n=1 Tax=Olivibacter ginsenosidimutans TaxID=1176537 RepID=A0ABP9CC15_9SPHI